MTTTHSDSPLADTGSSGVHSNLASGRPRVLSRQACDACRGRRTRCVLTSGNQSLSSPLDQDVERPVGNEARQCKRCIQLGLECTFLLPSKVRGPRRKRRSVPDRVSISSILQPSGSEASPLSPLPSLTTSVDNPASQIRQSMSSRSNGMLDSPLTQRIWHGSPQRLVDLPPLTLSYRTDALCSRALLKQILVDYLDFVYPLIPVVHRPSFRRDLANNRDSYDDDFLALIVCLCAVTVGIMPSRFRHYQSSNNPMRFPNRTEMLNRCYEIVNQLRGPNYFDELNVQKFAVSYLLTTAFFQIGQLNRSRMFEVESMQLARLLDFHRISSYRGLNGIEAQLRKKAFWLVFYAYVHGELQNLRKERLAFLDERTLRTISLEELMPEEIDDEMILEQEILSDDSGQLCLTSGFNLHSRVFWTALSSTRPRGQSIEDQEPCECVRLADPKLQLAHLRGRLNDLKYMLDGVAPELRPWTTGTDGSSWLSAEERERGRILDSQFTSMRANIHVTNLWLQTAILDQIDALLLGESRRPSAAGFLEYDPRATWSEREDICRQLLHILHSIPDINLEANGHHLTFKIRDVAVTLLSCPFEQHEEVAKRAHQYLLEFTNKLSRLDGSEILSATNLQSWVDTARRPGDK